MVEPTRENVQSSQRSIGVRTTVGLVLLALTLMMSVLLVVQNFQPIDVRIFRAEFSIRLGWALIIAGVIGVVMRTTLGWFLRRTRN